MVLNDRLSFDINKPVPRAVKSFEHHIEQIRTKTGPSQRLDAPWSSTRCQPTNAQTSSSHQLWQIRILSPRHPILPTLMPPGEFHERSRPSMKASTSEFKISLVLEACPQMVSGRTAHERTCRIGQLKGPQEASLEQTWRKAISLTCKPIKPVRPRRQSCQWVTVVGWEERTSNARRGIDFHRALRALECTNSRIGLLLKVRWSKSSGIVLDSFLIREDIPAVKFEPLSNGEMKTKPGSYFRHHFTPKTPTIRATVLAGVQIPNRYFARTVTKLSRDVAVIQFVTTCTPICDGIFGVYLSGRQLEFQDNSLFCVASGFVYGDITRLVATVCSKGAGSMSPDILPKIGTGVRRMHSTASSTSSYINLESSNLSFPPMATITPISAFTLGADTVYLKGRPLPTAPDGQYDAKVSSEASGPGATQEHSPLTNVINDVQAQIAKGPITPDPLVVAAFLDTVINPDSVDDRKGALGDGLTVLSRLPPDSDVAKNMSNSAIEMLYDTIPHPIETFLTPVYSFRQADGGNNNLMNPDIGRAGMPYARSVQGKWCYAPTALPDPELVFETLLKRRQAYQATQDLVRNKALGRGLLYPDTFSEERLLFLPPASSALLVILSRNHNYIADKLLKINERGRWMDPPPEDPTACAKQDEEIFQTARLINGGHFISLIMGDYVAGFLGLSEGNAWNMDAFDPFKDKNGYPVKRGEGNHCSVEFNVLYRWHPTISQADEQWINDFFVQTFNKPADTLTITDFGQGFLGTIASIPTDPSKREFAWLKRGPDGKFSDDDLAKVLQDATESVACSYGAQGTPDALKVIEIMGIQQARQWGCCTMNEFRQWLGLKRKEFAGYSVMMLTGCSLEFDTFEEWNPNPAIAGTARQLYKHIDNLELYTGLQCEALMPLSGGLRFAAGYTMTRAVLSDAIALIRGDRFYTTAFTPANLTTWGYQDCIRDPNNGGLGGEMPKLLMRHLPRHYPYNSVYGCFPFFTPTKMKDSLTRQGKADQYTFTRPVPAVPVKVLNTFTGINYVFNNPTQFPTVYDMKGLGNGYGFMLTFDQAAKHDTDKALVLKALFPDSTSIDTYTKWYKDGVTKRIANSSFTYDGVPGKYIDIVNDVINDAAIHWAADLLCGLDMKTKDKPTGMYTEEEIYDMFTCMFGSSIGRHRETGTHLLCFRLIFLAIGDNEHGFSLRQKVFQAGGVIQAMVAQSIINSAPKSAAGTNILLGAVSAVTSTVAGIFSNQPYAPFLQRLASTGRPINELVANVVGLAVGSSVNYAQAAVHVIDFYFDDARAAERAKIIALAQATDSASTETLRGYVREGMRLNPQVTGLYRDVLADASIPQGNSLPNLDVKKGDRLFGSLKNAHLNPTDFPNPTTIDPTRPASSYSYNGVGFHKCLGIAFAEQTITAIVGVVFSLKNVRRAPGNDGKLVGFTELQNATPTKVYVTDYGTTTPWPGAMHLVYDA
ncbi:hypothetical protein D9758_005455 [Tetrapyrgos nigripes]|uniref:Heme peroxidase n=1 Tax=Tetrapyrgos nigripes TaxID=182062 RepID=A0A8H5GHY7_9AGAR|nr:hypothetical protein D9758_005455 [Tetrapyrgos nigripes]